MHNYVIQLIDGSNVRVNGVNMDIDKFIEVVCKSRTVTFENPKNAIFVDKIIRVEEVK